MIKYDAIQGVGYVLDGSEDQPRDENGRWTGGGDPTRAGTNENGKPFKPRAFELTSESGTKHYFSDLPGEKDTFSFSSHDTILRESEAGDRMRAALDVLAPEVPGYEYTGVKISKSRVYHEYTAQNDRDTPEPVIQKPFGTFRRAK